MNIHPLSEVQSKRIGKNTVIWQYVIILPGATIGSDCNINAFCFIENDVIIGNDVTIKCGVHIWDGITLENNVFVGPNVTFINDKYPRSKLYPQEFIKTYIEEGASIGANSTIMAGLRIGRYAMIGAGSVVTKNVPANTIWFGIPARQRGFVCNCGHVLDKSSKCHKCGLKYKVVNNKITLL